MNISIIVLISVISIWWMEIFMNGVVLNGIVVFMFVGNVGVSLVMCVCIVCVVCIVLVFGDNWIVVVVVGMLFLWVDYV